MPTGIVSDLRKRVNIQRQALRANATSEGDGLPTPRRQWATLAILLGISLAVLDGSIANVALPTIARDLQISPSASIWVVNAFQLTMVASVLPLAALGEIIGYRNVYVAGLGLFTAASLACALSGSIDVLALARGIQGLGAAGMMGMNGALIRYSHPQARLGRALGMNAMIIAVSSALGPSLAAAILSVASWPWLFGVNVPIGIATIIVASLALPQIPRADRRFDWKSALLNAIMFAAVIWGIETWGRGGVVAGLCSIAIGTSAGVALITRDWPKTAPLIPFDLLRIRIFRVGIVSTALSYATMMLIVVSLPFYLQAAAGRTVVQTGVLITAWPAGAGMAAVFAGRLADRWSPELISAIGLAILAMGSGALAWMSAGASDTDIALRIGLCGIGFGFFASPNNRLLILSAPKLRSGAAGGIMSTGRLTGQTAGTAALAVVFRIANSETTNLPLVAAAVVAVVAALINLSRFRGKR